MNARLAAVGYPGQTVTTGHLRHSGRQPQPAGQDRPRLQRPRPAQRALQPLRRRLRELARRRRPECAVGIGRARQPRPGGLGQQHAHARRPHRQRDAGAVHPQRPAGAADRSGRSGRQHRRRGVVRHLSVESPGPPQQDVPAGEQRSLSSAARMRCVPASTWSTTTTPSRSRGRCAAPTRSRRWPTSSPAPTTTPASRRPSATPRSQQGSTNLGLYVQDEWSATPSPDAQPRPALRPAVARDIDTDTNNVSPRVGFAWTPLASRDLVVRGSAGLYFDRVPLRALANALLSADNTTDLAKLRQRNIASRPARPARRSSRTSCRRPCRR